MRLYDPCPERNVPCRWRTIINLPCYAPKYLLYFRKIVQVVLLSILTLWANLCPRQWTKSQVWLHHPYSSLLPVERKLTRVNVQSTPVTEIATLLSVLVRNWLGLTPSKEFLIVWMMNQEVKNCYTWPFLQCKDHIKFEILNYVTDLLCTDFWNNVSTCGLGITDRRWA